MYAKLIEPGTSVNGDVNPEGCSSGLSPGPRSGDCIGGVFPGQDSGDCYLLGVIPI